MLMSRWRSRWRGVPAILCAARAAPLPPLARHFSQKRARFSLRSGAEPVRGLGLFRRIHLRAGTAVRHQQALAQRWWPAHLLGECRRVSAVVGAVRVDRGLDEHDGIAEVRLVVASHHLALKRRFRSTAEPAGSFVIWGVPASDTPW